MNDFLQVLLGIIAALVVAAGLIAWAQQIETWIRAGWRKWKQRKTNQP